MNTFGVFPAYAGVILFPVFLLKKGKRISRIRGGDPMYKHMLCFMQIVFPAYAGVILSHLYEALDKDRISRIRGGDPGYSVGTWGCNGYFPHTRG